MKERAALVTLWLLAVALAVTLELTSAWRAGGATASLLPGVAWWLLVAVRMREYRWLSLLLAPATGVFSPASGLAGSGAFGMALAAALMPVRLLEYGWWQLPAGCAFTAGVTRVSGWLIELAAGRGMLQPLQVETIGWLLSALASSLLAAVLCAAWSLLGFAGSRHISTCFFLDLAGAGSRIRTGAGGAT